MQILIAQQTAHKNVSFIQNKYSQKLKQLFSDLEIHYMPSSALDFNRLGKEVDIVVAMADDIKRLSDFPRLKWVHLTSAGANALSDELINSQIIVSNSSGVHPIPISEHVFGLMLMLSRGLHKAVKVQVTQKKWLRDIDYYQPGELSGKKLLVVGMGRIGERVARLGEAFEMDVAGVVRDLNGHKTSIRLVSSKDLSKELKQADFIVNCLPSTSQTVGLFDKKLLSKFKKGSFFINIGRGDTVDEAALVKALQSGDIAGAGLDVFETEPLNTGSPLWEMENVIITPHYSGANPHYFERMMEIFLVNFKAYIQKRPLPNIVDKKLGY